MDNNPRVEHLLESIEMRRVLVELGVLGKYDITTRNITCPFHAFGRERSPSARCYEESETFPSGHFHCFTCGRTWSPIHFVMEYKAMEFWEAVKWLERTFGVIPPPLSEMVTKESFTPPPTPLVVSSLPHKLDLADQLLRKYRASIEVGKFRLYSDLSDLLRWQLDQGASAAPERVVKFLSQLKKVLGLGE